MPRSNKRFILFFSLLIVLSFTLAACLSTDNQTTATSESSESVPETIQTTTAETTPVTETESEPDPIVERPSEDNPVIALTFDDGPSLRDTGKLLDLLAQEEVAATFFVLGSQIDMGREDLVKRAWEEGHEIANHGYSHKVLRGIAESEIREELESTSSLIKNITGQQPGLMRPPTGAYDEQVARVSGELGMSVINWDWISCPEDWNHHDNPDHIANHVIETAQNGHIVLLHDTNEATIAAMPEIIKGLKERGFRFMTVSEMLSWLGDEHPAPGKVYFTYSMPEND